MNRLPFKHRVQEADFEKRMKELDEKEKQLEREGKIRSRERELGLRRTWKKPAWSKLMMGVIFGICIEIVFYAEWIMYVRYDVSALYALIGVPAAMFGTFFAYCEKAKKENTTGGITYELAMKDSPTIEPISEEQEPEPVNAETGDEGVG